MLTASMLRTDRLDAGEIALPEGTRSFARSPPAGSRRTMRIEGWLPIWQRRRRLWPLSYSRPTPWVWAWPGFARKWFRPEWR